MRVGNGGLAGALRGIGGMLLALGAFITFLRRSPDHGWTDFELLLTLAVPAAGLYALAVTGRATPAERRAQPWRAVLLVTAMLLSVLALFQFLAWAGASTGHPLYDAAVLAAIAALGIHSARRAAAPYALLLAGIALLGAWILVWLKIFPHASVDTVRVVILTGGVALLVAGGVTALLDGDDGGELAIAGGLGLVVAGVQGVLVSLAGAAIANVTSTSTSSETSASGVTTEGPVITRHIGDATHLQGAQTTGWNVYLLVVSIGLIWCAARSRRRGLGYVGAAGILAFSISVGAQLIRLAAGHSPSTSLLGWPLALVLLGLAGLAAPLVLQRRSR